MQTIGELRSQLAQATALARAQTAEIDAQRRQIALLSVYNGPALNAEVEAQRKQIALLQQEKITLQGLSIPVELTGDVLALLASYRLANTSAPPPVVVEQNIPPSVALSATVITSIAPGAVSLLAVASVPDGIKKVEFYCDSNLIFTAFSAPYTYTYTGIAAGVHNFSAKAYANSGLSATATAQATITQIPQQPQNQPPNASLSAVAMVQSDPGAVNVSVTASDPDGSISKVEIMRGAQIIATLTQAPFSFTDTGLAAGTYNYSAKAYDNQGATASASPAQVTINSASQQTNPVLINPI